MNKISILTCMLITVSVSTLTLAESPKHVTVQSVPYYADPMNKQETRKVLEECKSRIKTVFDYEIVMSQENCKNAQIGEIAAFRKQQREDLTKENHQNNIEQQNLEQQ